MKNFSEEEIIRLIKAGKDHKVVPILYKKVLPVLKKYIMRRNGREEDALDAFHDALLLFYKQVAKGVFDPKYKIEGYIFRVGVNTWINKVKRDNAMVLTENFEDEQLIDTTHQVQHITTDENMLRSMFSNLGEKCVELLTYTTYYNLLLEDIMIRMEFSSVNAVKMQYQRCKKKLIAEIEKKPWIIDKLRGSL